MNDRLWIRKARPAFPMLLAASAWMSPGAAADTIDRNLTDPEYEDLYNDIIDETAPGFGPRLVAAFPSAANVNGEWLGEVVALLAANYEEATDELGLDDEAAPPAVPVAVGPELMP